MTIETLGSFVSIDESNIRNTKSSVKQLIDIVQSDIASVSGDSTRKSYEVFTSGGTGQNNITSSLHQTVFDQDFTLGTSNPLFDITVGSRMEVTDNDVKINGETSHGGNAYTLDNDGKLNDPGISTSMVREKVNVYKQFAQTLLGDADQAFFTPHGATEEDAGTSAKEIKGAVFICFRRLFTRDNIDKQSFSMRLHKEASKLYSDFRSTVTSSRETGESTTNISAKADINTNDNHSSYTISDSVKRENNVVAGEVATLQDSNNNNIGLIYYDSGIIVLDVERAFDKNQIIRGAIDSCLANQIIDEKYVLYAHKSNEPAGTAKYYDPVYTETADGRGVLGGDGTTWQPLDKDGNASGAARTFYIVTSNNSNNSISNGTVTRPDVDYPLYLDGATFTNDTSNYYDSVTLTASKEILFNGKLFPNLWVSGTIDDIVDHICETRFGRGTNSAITFRNETVINSSLVFCRAAPSQLNYSTNPTYTDASGNLIATESNGEPFSYVTTVGLYDSNSNLVAVAKTSRPIEKNPETDLSIRIRLDY
tara:strand:+ start:1136 stop:2746 length:1611 start_codon:yes stop_codon:yes gene_type:complete